MARLDIESYEHEIVESHDVSLASLNWFVFTYQDVNFFSADFYS